MHERNKSLENTVEPPITDTPNSRPPPYIGPPATPVHTVHFLLPKMTPPNSGQWTSAAYLTTLSYIKAYPIMESGWGSCGRSLEIAHWVTLSRSCPSHAGSIRMLLAFGSESDPNSNCSSLAWSASSPNWSYVAT